MFSSYKYIDPDFTQSPKIFQTLEKIQVVGKTNTVVEALETTAPINKMVISRTSITESLLVSQKTSCWRNQHGG